MSGKKMIKVRDAHSLQNTCLKQFIRQLMKIWKNSWLVQEVLAAPPAKGFTKLWESRASAYVSLWNYELKAFGPFISP
jgi:hypothetical protein